LSLRSPRYTPGQYTLVKASIAGAIVANTLFMLGASFSSAGSAPCAGIQQGQRRLQAGLLFLATVAILIPSAVTEADTVAGSRLPRR